MAEFGEMRLCTQAEFDYYEEERRDLQTLQPGELLVAMFVMAESVETESGTFPAVTAPLKFVEIYGPDIFVHLFEFGKFIDEVDAFSVLNGNYVDADGLEGYAGREYGHGYIRDRHNGLDGDPSEINTAKTIRRESGLLIPA